MATMTETPNSREYVLVGGPADGQRFTTNGAHVLRVPIRRPVEVFRKVVPFDRWDRQTSMDIADYELVGGTYRYEGLVRDAGAEMAVTRQIWVEAGARREVRRAIRDNLQELQPDKEIDGIIWRIVYDRYRDILQIRALVGGRRVEHGLWERRQRRELLSKDTPSA
jgi:hypothetical protein